VEIGSTGALLNARCARLYFVHSTAVLMGAARNTQASAQTLSTNINARACEAYSVSAITTFLRSCLSEMPMRETVRSGRRDNYYVTDNGFIDHYAREMQPADIAVYHALERYANCHTRSTWVGTAKIAEVLNVSQRTVQRSLKVLEDLKLIRIVQTPTVKMYFIVPVPPRARTVASPLFDSIAEEDFFLDTNTGVAHATPASHFASSASRTSSPVTRAATAASPNSDTDDGVYKEEQDLLNKTKEQYLFNKGFEDEDTTTINCAHRIVAILKLTDSSMSAAVAAVEERRKQTNLSMDGIVQEIVTEAHAAWRRGIENHEFLGDFLSEQMARQILKNLGLPVTNNLVSIVKASVNAEATYSQLSVDKVTDLITSAAIEDRRRGLAIDRFYFEGVKWRSNVRVSKAEQRTLDNLEINARAKQRLRNKFGTP
jgi:DNA-binding transcriptional ArsR family regulator